MIKKLKVTVDSHTYDVTVELPNEPAPAPVVKEASPVAAAPSEPRPAPVAPPPAAKASGPGDVVSPLAGRVVSIGVEVGQQVKEGDHVLTLEAMKMNTFVFAPKAGKITEIRTQVGTGVQEGDVLLVLE